MINKRIFGTIYICGEPASYGKRYSRYKNAPELTIGNTRAGKEIAWLKVNGLLIADRNLVENISWYDLDAQGLVFGRAVQIDGQKYKLRLLGRNADGDAEWDAALEASQGEILPLPFLWNCDGVASWTQEAPPGNPNCKILRGGAVPKNCLQFSIYDRGNATGWRPVLEPLKLQLSELVKQNVFIHGCSGVSVSGILLGYTDYDFILATHGDLPKVMADGKFAAKLEPGVYVFNRSLVAEILLSGR